MKNLEKQLTRKFKDVEVEVNRAAAREVTPAAKARAFAKVLRKHGVDNVDEAGLRKKFSA